MADLCVLPARGIGSTTPKETNMFKQPRFAWLAVGLLIAAAASAQTNPYQKGPAPTKASLEAPAGPFATRTTALSAASVSGFGGGVLYHPTAPGRYGAIAICPGFTARASSLSWLGPRLA